MRSRSIGREIEKTEELIRRCNYKKEIHFRPPYDTKLDELMVGEHCGCRSMRKVVEDNQFLLHLCGHLHENEEKKDNIGKTQVINPSHEGTLIEI